MIVHDDFRIFCLDLGDSLECSIITSETNEKFREQNHKNFEDLKLSLIITSIIIFIVVVAAAALVPGSISRPMITMKRAAEHVGNTGSLVLPDALQNEVNNCVNRKDELGQSLRAMVSMLGMFTDRAHTLSLISDGDLSSRVALKSDQDTIGISLQRMLVSLNELLAEIKLSSEQVAQGSNRVADGSQSLASKSSEQSAAVTQMTDTIKTVADMIKSNTEISQEAANLGSKIRIDAENGTRQMENMVVAVEEISQASQSINRVMKVIDDIAFQTNILALNAAVEAARAGQHGKGFAVVAEEVRNLASKSADAAKETSNMISNSISKAEVGSSIARETSESLFRIVAGINRNSDIISEIASSGAGQNITIDEISRGIDQMNTVVHETASIAQESAATAEEMSGQATMLTNMVSRFKLKDTD